MKGKIRQKNFVKSALHCMRGMGWYASVVQKRTIARLKETMIFEWKMSGFFWGNEITIK